MAKSIFILHKINQLQLGAWHRYILVGILGFALLLRVWQGVLMDNHPLAHVALKYDVFDQSRFYNLALNLARGDWLGGKEVYAVAPLYVYLLALMLKFFGEATLGMRLLQGLLGTIGCWLIYDIGRMVFGRMVGIIASFLMAFCGILVFYDSALLREALTVFLALLSCWLLLQALKDSRRYRWVLAGLALGLSLILRPSLLILFVPVWLIVLSLRRDNPILVRQGWIMVLLGIFIVVGPVTLRNRLMGGKWVLVSTQGIAEFWVGNSPDSLGVDFVPSETQEKLVQSSGHTIWGTLKVFLAQIKQYPAQYARLYARKIKMFFNGYEIPANFNFYLMRENSFPLRIAFINFTLLSLLGWPGVVLSLFQRQRPTLLYVYILALSLGVILFHVQSRYRLAVVPFISLFAAYSVWWAVSQARKKKFISLGIWAVVLFFLGILIKPDPTYGFASVARDYIRFCDYQNASLAYMEAYQRTHNKEYLLMGQQYQERCMDSYFKNDTD